MQFVEAHIGYKRAIHFKFRDGGKTYSVVRSADDRTITFKVRFARDTRNPFGNGSLGVHQTGYRTLPYGGATYRRLRSAYESFLQNPALKRIFATA
jgi:hypothetical protein